MNSGHRTILIADTSFTGSPARSWQSRLAPLAGAFWPSERTPKLETVSAQWLLGRLEAKPPERLQSCAVLLIVDETASPAFVDRFMQGLMSTTLAGVVLIKSHESWRSTQQDGVLFESLEAPETKIAALLYALSERQAAVNLLATEVELANRCQEGVRLEMERLHEELNLAASIQREFTSAPLPEADGLNFSVLFRPVNFVSGDVYAVRPLDAEHLGFLVADAVGHGVPAALLTMVLANSLTPIDHSSSDFTLTTGSTPALSPAEVLRRLNNRLCEVQGEQARFATAVYGVINTRTRVVRLAGAGHPHPIVVNPRHDRSIETMGPLLGVFPDAEFDEVSFVLDSGETLLIYTDGLESSLEPADRSTGAVVRAHIDGMVNAVRCAEVGSSLPSRLTGLIDGHLGSLHQMDDVTVLAICAVEQAAAKHVRRAA